LLTTVLCLVVVCAAAGCRKSAEQSAEQRAIERHEQEVRRQKEWASYFRNPASARTMDGARFLSLLHDQGQLPGISPQDHELLGCELKMPVVSPKGPYYWSQEFHVIFKDSPPKHCHYVLVQTYNNGGFQLQKAWRSDGAGKVLEEYPIVPAPAMADATRVFLGPANPGAECAWSGWYNGTLGGGSVAIGTNDPATGLSCFEIGITNAVSGATHHADIRSEMFPLGKNTRGPFTFSFAYKLPTKVKPWDNIEVNFRFFGDREANFLGQKAILVGSSTGDSEMTQYKTVNVSGIPAPSGAVKADVWLVANIAGPWTSGTAQFDDFSVTAVPVPAWRGALVKLGVGTIAGLGLGMIWMFYRRGDRGRLSAIQKAAK
jgi:hypothetical protein